MSDQQSRAMPVDDPASSELTTKTRLVRRGTNEAHLHRTNDTRRPLWPGRGDGGETRGHRRAHRWCCWWVADTPGGVVVDMEGELPSNRKNLLRHPTRGNAKALWACRPFSGQRQRSWSDPVRLRAVDEQRVLFFLSTRLASLQSAIELDQTGTFGIATRMAGKPAALGVEQRLVA
jgi:hypothetical protein